MPSTKKRRRAKRHAENLVEQAIETAASGQHHLAEKLIERALGAGPANARFWIERARIALLRGATSRAERAVRRALELSPTYAEAQALLDEIAPAAADLRREVYARPAPIVNGWNELIGDPRRWPSTPAAFERDYQAAGHGRTSPILLRYEPGSFNGFHRDVYGSIFFPLQMALSLRPARSGGSRGTPPGYRSTITRDRSHGATMLGRPDAVVTCRP